MEAWSFSDADIRTAPIGATEQALIKARQRVRVQPGVASQDDPENGACLHFKAWVVLAAVLARSEGRYEQTPSFRDRQKAIEHAAFQRTRERIVSVIGGRKGVLGALKGTARRAADELRGQKQHQDRPPSVREILSPRPDLLTVEKSRVNEAERWLGTSLGEVVNDALAISTKVPLWERAWRAPITRQELQYAQDDPRPHSII